MRTNRGSGRRYELLGADRCGRAVTNIDGNVTVPDGKSCTLSFVNITANVRVDSGATLIVSAYTEASDYEIGGNIEAKNCRPVLLQGNGTIGRNLRIHSCNGTASNGLQGPDVHPRQF